MSRRLFCFVIVSLLVGAAAADPPDQGKKDLEEMQGKWHAAAIEMKGVPSDREAIKKITLIVKSDTYSVKVHDEDHVSAKLILRADEKPSQLDLVLETGPVYKCIYKIDADTLKICINLSSDADSERPKEFKSDETANTALFTWERTK